MTFLVLLRRTPPGYRLDRPLEGQDGWAAHAAFMDRLVERGSVLLGGPLADERRVVLVMAAASEAEVRSLLAQDPWSGTHLVVDSIDRWTLRLGALPAR